MNAIEICEQDNEDIKNGRVKVKISALEIHNPNDLNSHNKNGIKWLTQYVENNIKSAIGMPYVCSFIDDDKTYPSDHGTLTHDENGNAVFENSEVVGYVDKVYIEDVEFNGELKTVMQTEGYLYYQRFPNLVKFLREMKADGNKIDSSIEINGKDGNKQIVYLDGDKNPDGTKKVNRIPVEFSFTGLAILYLVPPGDEYAQLLEINTINNQSTDNKSDDIEQEQENNSKEDKAKMDELNVKIAELNAKIAELNTAISEKDAEINKCKEELNASITKETELNALLVDVNKSVESQKTQITELNTEIEPLRQMRNEADKAKAQTEVNSYFETVKAENGFTEVELNSLKSDYVDKCDLEGLKKKEEEICINKFKEMRKATVATAELNTNTDAVDTLFFSTKIETVETNSAEDGSELFK